MGCSRCRCRINKGASVNVKTDSARRVKNFIALQSRIRAVFLESCSKRSGVRVGDVAGSVYDNGYRYIQIDGEDYKAGRLAWFFVTGEDPQDFIDHENRVKNDDRFSNLRVATNSQNQANAFWRTNTSGIKGIRYESKRGKWLATITKDGTKRNLGRFKRKIDAAMAYRKAAIEAWGEFAKVPSEEELEALCNEDVEYPLTLGETNYEDQ